MVIDEQELPVSWCGMVILIRRCRARAPDRSKDRRVGDAKSAGNLASAQAGAQQTMSLIQVLRGQHGAA